MSEREKGRPKKMLFGGERGSEASTAIVYTILIWNALNSTKKITAYTNRYKNNRGPRVRYAYLPLPMTLNGHLIIIATGHIKLTIMATYTHMQPTVHYGRQSTQPIKSSHCRSTPTAICTIDVKNVQKKNLKR